MIGLVRAGDLDRWASRISAASEFPRLVRLLVHATAAGPTQVDFPADEATRFAGWDGRVLTHAASPFVPGGFSGWELGTGQDPHAKANEDYRKRTRDALGLDPAQTTFVFATPRMWARRDDWIAERRAEGVWKDVVAFDAESLVQWLEIAPGVAAWLAPLIGSVPPNVRALQNACEDFTAATRPTISLAGLLIGRAALCNELLAFLRGPPGAIEISATTASEGIAFVGACVQSLPEQEAESLWARAICVDSTVDLRVLAGRPLIVVGSAVLSVEAEHHVIHVGQGPGRGRHLIELGAQPVSALVEFLAEQGLDRNDAYQRCQDASGYLERVRHTLLVIAASAPPWAAPSVNVTVAAAILIGAWDEARDADRDVVSRISGVGYEEFVRAVIPFQTGASPLVSRVETVWKVYGRSSAWKHLEPALTMKQIEVFLEQATDVLLEADPRFELAPNERWMAQVHGKGRAHSSELRTGLADALVCAAVLGRDSSACYAGRRAQSRIDGACRRLFEKRDEAGFWRRIRDELKELAEASPDSFLSALEKEIAQENPQIRDLFEDEGDHGGCLHCDLLWALESLAWAPKYLGRAALILAALADLDPGGRMSNRPSRSLAEMLLPARPQSSSTAAERQELLRLIVRRYPKAGWDLGRSLMPTGTTVVTPGAEPRLREWKSESERPSVLIADYWSEIQSVAELMLEMAGSDAARWHYLLSNLNALLPQLKDRVLLAAEEFARAVEGEARLLFWGKLRKLLHRHNEFSAHENVDWVYSREVIERLERLYAALTPEDSVDRVAWLFRFPVERPSAIAVDWRQEQENIQVAQGEAAEVLSRLPFDDLMAALPRLENHHALGYYLARSSAAATIEPALVRRCAVSMDDRERQLVRGFAAASHQADAKRFLQRWCSSESEGHLSPRGIATILQSIPPAPDIWDLVESAGAECSDLFWKETSVHLFDRPREAERAAANLLRVGRAFSAIDLLALNAKSDWLSGDADVKLIVDALVAGVTEANDDPALNQRIAYEIANLLKALHDSGRLDPSELMRLEWMYFGILEHQAQHELVIYKHLISDPQLLLDIVALAYIPEGEAREMRPERNDRAKALATQAWHMLDGWKPFAGAGPQEMLSSEQLAGIVEQLRKLAAERRHVGIVDDIIGKALASSPVGVDGIWPHETIRDAIERFGSDALDEGFVIGKSNLRGVTSRLPGDGGAQERTLAEQYEGWQRALAMTHPRTSTLVGRLADMYRSDATHQDAGRFLLR